jgi:hypothetical protein
VDIPTGANFAVTQWHINQAIKAAISGDAVLSKLLSAEDGPGNALVIKSLVDGTHNDADLLIGVTGSDFDGFVATTGEGKTVLDAFKAFSKNSLLDLEAAEEAQIASLTNINGRDGIGENQVLAEDGIDSEAETDNVIDAGAGSDVIVLSTSLEANETIVFTAASGVDLTIVNFGDVVPADDDDSTGLDKLDFKAYLTNLASESESTVSQNRIVTSIDGDPVLTANEVAVLRVDSTLETAENFANLTAARLLSALNGGTDWAGLSDDLDADDAVTDLVGKSAMGLVLVENDANLGEYKIFQMTWESGTNDADGDFATAVLIGTVDFGATVDFTVPGTLA